MPPGKRIAIVCNPLAGAGRSVVLAEKIVAALQSKNIRQQLFTEKWPEGFSDFTDAWIAGGDGTLNYFINAYSGINIPLVIFKGGTGNDVHWLLYGKKSFEEQLEIVLTAAAHPIDAGICNDRLFINGVGIGFEGAVSKSLTGKKKLPGKTSFLITILQKIFTYRSKFYKISTGPDSGEAMDIEGKKLIISICNGRRAGGGFHIAPVADADDGWLDAVMIEPIGLLQRFRYLPVIEKGRHLDLPFVQHLQLKKLVVESDELIQYHLDGEYAASKKLEIEILPSKFRFRF